MPKKRFTPQYSKPQSTVHPSLKSPATTSNSAQNDVQPSVNELIASLRKSTLSVQPAASTSNTAHTLPPQIRHLLAEPETPGPRPRARRRFDANGRLIPPGPSAPQSWLGLERSHNTRKGTRQLQNAYPIDLNHLPGISARERNGTSLVDICLRNIATHWEEMHEYERNNLLYLPVKLRTLLLSYIAVHGPEEGVGYDGLRNLILPPPLIAGDEGFDESSTFHPAENNEGFFRLDLSGAMGKSVTFRQLTELIEKPETPPASDDELSWEETMSPRNSLSAPIPLLTHLSLSHPAQTISWSRLLSFAKLLPNLTHLSLAFWPVPSLTPNAKTAVMQGSFGRDVQYGGTNYYSHSLDNDYSEAAEVLRRLALRLYGLEYLDLTGCSDWLRALRWRGDAAETDRGIDWSTQWTKLNTLKVLSGLELSADSEYDAVVHFVECYKEALATEDMLRWWVRRSKAQGRRANWIDVVKDDWVAYGELWAGHRVGGNLEDVKKKRTLLDTLKNRHSEGGDGQWRAPVTFEADERVAEGAVERLSVWEQ